MAYNFLVNATKNRIINELRDVFAKHPHFNKLEIVNKFPYEERIQEGIIVRNTTAGRIALAADNFQGTVTSYAAVAKHTNSKSLSIEWVREDSNHLSERMHEDFSHQFTNFPQLNVTIQLNEHFVKTKTDLDYADDKRSVDVRINGQRVLPIVVDGENKQIILSSAPPTNSTVTVSYWSRNLAPAGIYQLEITSGKPEIYEFEFMLDAMLERNQIVISNADGTETSAILNSKPIYPGSLKLKENESLMVEGTDYEVDNQTGIITFLQSPPVLKGANITATYRTKGLSTGPFKIPHYNQAVNTALPGVVIAFGKGVSIGDKHFIIVTNRRETIAHEYSGKWDMGISLDIYAKDSHKIEEIIDITTSSLLQERKEDLDAEGIALVDVSFGGESEQIFDEATGDLYYMGSVDYQFLTEWLVHRPLLRTLEGFEIEFELVTIEEAKDAVFGMPKSFERVR
jgi:hypothetical protein